MPREVGVPARIEHDALGDYDCFILPPQPGKPNSLATGSQKETPTPTDNCPLCPGHEPEMGPVRGKRGEPWQSLALRNLWPVGMEHDVIILTNRHVGLYDLTETEWATSLDLIKGLTRNRKVILFANHGQAAGASQYHSHAQLLRSPVGHTLSGDNHRCVGDDCVLCNSDNAGDLIFTSHGWDCVSPAAPKQSHELRLIANTHRDHLEPEALAAALTESISLTEKALGRVPFNLVFHIIPGTHAHVHLFPRAKEVSVYMLGWGHPCVADPVEYSQHLRTINP